MQWATRGDLAGLAPESSRVTTVGAAIDRRDDAAVAGTVTIVAVDAPMRTDAYWTAQMLAIWSPVAVWAVVEATRKPEDLEPWLDGLPAGRRPRSSRTPTSAPTRPPCSAASAAPVAAARRRPGDPAPLGLAAL